MGHRNGGKANKGNGDCARWLREHVGHAGAGGAFLRLRAREEMVIREAIDQAWGEALEDGSVPPTELQNKIVERVLMSAGHEQPQSAADRGNEILKDQHAARDTDPRPAEEIIREQRDEWQR